MASKVVTLTKAEQAAISTLEGLSKAWPDDLQLFAHYDILLVLKDGLEVDRIHSFPIDGGDPSEPFEEAEVQYE